MVKVPNLRFHPPWGASRKGLSHPNVQDIVILLGDLNAKIGDDNVGLNSVMGRHGTGVRNENGGMFIDLCMNYNLVIGGSLFPHKDIHKATWVAPNQRTFNQIDHIAISKKWRRSLLDVRSYRGADVASDHHLVVAQLRLKLAANKALGQRMTWRKLNIEKFNHGETRKKFKEELKKSLDQERMNELNSMEHWTVTKKAMLAKSENILGISQRKQPNEWIMEETWNKRKARKATKQKIINADDTTRPTLLAEYAEINKRVKKYARRDKRARADELAHKAQLAAETNNSKELYQITKRLAGKPFTHNQTGIIDAARQMLASPQDQLTKWQEYFKSNLAAPPQQKNTTNTQLAPDTSKIPSGAPTVNEIKTAIKHLKSNKASGLDNLPPEIFKTYPHTVAKILEPLFKKVWDSGHIPSEWKKGLIIKLPKKGDLTECHNWRGITLLNTICKVLATIIYNRLKEELEPKMRPEQAGFRPNKSCADHINTLRIIVEQSVEFGSPLQLVFMDFQQAFDTLAHNAIWKALKEKGVPQKMVNITKAIYDQSTCNVLHKNQISETIPVLNGVKQGSVLSPLLFNVTLVYVVSKASKNSAGIRWGLCSKLTDLDYADDICLLAHSTRAMQTMLERTVREAAKVGLKINVNKSKEMRIAMKNNKILCIHGETMERMTQFAYLGSIINNTGGTEVDITTRIRKTQAAFSTLNKIWHSTAYSTQTKLRIFNTNVKAVLLYGCETWKNSKSITVKLQVFVSKCLRKILRIFWPDQIMNRALWKRTNQPRIDLQIRKRKWGWLGHTLRKPSDIARQALEWNPQGKRGRGRPKNTWRRMVLEEAKGISKTWAEIKADAKNRVRWRILVEALCSAVE